jgi:hypothetical protein
MLNEEKLKNNIKKKLIPITFEIKEKRFIRACIPQLSQDA